MLVLLVGGGVTGLALLGALRGLVLGLGGAVW